VYFYTHGFCREVLLPLHGILHRSFFLGSHYGLFANMTKVRNEIVIELSRDKGAWQEVHFLAKPGDIDAPPKAVRPFFHLPRLDWVMWFLSFRAGKEDLPKWFWVLLVSLMTGDSPEVQRLLHPTLNPGIAPHSGEAFEYVRLTLVTYQFSGRAVVNMLQSSADAAASTNEATDGSSSGGVLASTAGRTTGRYWSTSPARTILPATSLEEVYALLDAQDEALQRLRGQRRPPTAESAADLIMRTLFAKMQAKKEAKTD
jgi:hypothetical protein